jgi:hypothetical protein
MVFSYYNRLTAERKRTYRKSDEIKLSLPAGVDAGALIRELEQTLIAEERARTQTICQQLLDMLTREFNVPRTNVAVLAVRPNNSEGELHGFYEPTEGAAAARVSIWMRTAQRKQVVAFRTFLRTLIHELCHHLDYELFQLPETFHTEGFYKRESALVYALLGQATKSHPQTSKGKVKAPRQKFSATQLLNELREKPSETD